MAQKDSATRWCTSSGNNLQQDPPFDFIRSSDTGSKLYRKFKGKQGRFARNLNKLK